MRKLFAVLCTLACAVAAQAQNVAVTSTSGSSTSNAYTTLKLAFDAINAGTHQGTVVITINGNTTEGTTPATLNNSGIGAAAYTSVSIRPGADGVAVTGNPISGFGVIQLNGADNVTIDGDNPGTTGTNRNLTINNTSTTTYNSVIRVATGTSNTTANSITIKNVNLNGGVVSGNASTTTSSSGGAATQMGVLVGSGASSTNSALTATSSVTPTMSTTAGFTANNFTVTNCAINQVGRGIVFAGGTAANTNLLTITNNIIGGAGSLSGVSAPYTSPATTVYVRGIYVSGVTSMEISGNTIRNIVSYISNTTYGIDLASSIGTTGGTILVNNNVISGVVNNNNGAFWAVGGINLAAAAVAVQIKGNVISGIHNITGSAANGIVTVTSATASPSIEISNNQVSNVYNDYTSGGAARGIAHSSGNNVLLFNNFISDINAYAISSLTSTSGKTGIHISGGTGHKIYHNSVNLYGSILGGTGTDISNALHITTTGATGMDVRNNIFSNQMTRLATNGAQMNRAAVTLPSGPTVSMNLTLNNNAYYSTSDTIVSAGSGVYYKASAFSKNATTPATNLRALTSTLSAAATNDNGSYASSAQPPFLNNADLHLDANDEANLMYGGDNSVVTANSTLLNKDIDGNSRPLNSSVPLYGADEIALPVCDPGNLQAGNPNSSGYMICLNGTQQLSMNSYTTAVGTSYQWYTADGNGNLVSPVSGATTPSLTVGSGLAAGTYYYVFTASCSGTRQNAQVVQLDVNPNPVVTITPSATSFCYPNGTAPTMTAAGAVSYAWSPAASLSAATGATVTVAANAATTYTVTGTDANGCVGTATQAITVTPGAVIQGISASPATICAGNTSQLSSTALATALARNYTFSGTVTATSELDPMTGASSMSGASNDDTPGAPAEIGFTFYFDGKPYTRFAASPDGWMTLGTSALTATPSSEYDNSLASVANPKLAVLWDDLATGTGGSVRYVVTGTAPNRILKVQWFVTVPRSTSSAANTTFQAWLYEADGKIEYRYGAIAANSGAATIGLISSSASNYLHVTASATPTASNSTAFNSNTAAIAANTVYTFTVPALTYSWTPAATLSDAAIANPQVTSAFNATTTYTLTVTSPTGCSATGTTTVSISTGAPSISGLVTTPATSVCPGTSISINANQTGGCSPILFRLWSNAATAADTLSGGPAVLVYSGSTFSGSNATVAPSATTNYLLAVYDNSNSSDVKLFTVNVYPVSGISISPSSAAICGNGNVTLTASGATSYSWSPAGGLNAATGATVIASGVGNITYTVTGTDANGCVGTASRLVSYVPAQTITVTPSASAICSNQISTLNTSVSAIASNVKGYVFSTGTGSTLDPMTGSTSLLGSGQDDAASATVAIGFNFSYEGATYTHFAAASDGWMRIGNSSFSASGDYTNQLNENFDVPKLSPYWDDLHTGTTGGVRYVVRGTAPNRILVVQWFVTVPYSSTGAANSTFQAWLYEGSGRIEYRYGTMGSGAMSASVGITGNSSSNYNSVTVSSNTNSTTTANDAVAEQPASGRFYAFGAPTSAQTPYTYSWSPATFLSDNTAQNPIVSNLTATTTYTVTVTGASGCTNTAQTTITLATGAPNVSALTLTPATPVCPGTAVAIAPNLTGGCNPFTYRLFRNATQASDTLSGGTATLVYSGGSFTGANASVAPAVTTNYYLLVTDNSNQTGEKFFTVNVNVPGVLTVTPSSATICNNVPVNLTATGSAGTYTWSPATGLSATNTAAVTATPTGTMVYTVTGTDANGCTATGSTTLRYVPVPALTVTATPATICSGQNVSVLAAITPIQTANVYSFTSGTGAALDPMSGATALAFSGNDDAVSATTAIGFTFPYEGTTYTHFSAATDGWLMLGASTMTAASDFSNNLNESTNVPKLSPLWDDLSTGTDGYVKYTVTGTAPNRILVVEWFVTLPRSNSAAANSTFQAWLYETSGKIEYRYGTMGAPSSASVGITGAANTNYLGVNVAAGYAASGVVKDDNSVQPAAGTMYTFLPPSAQLTYSWTPATFLDNASIANPTATAVTASTSWTANVTDAAGCSYSAATTVNITAQPISIGSVTASNNNYCVSSVANSVLTANVVGGCPPYTYVWSANGSTLQTQTSPSMANTLTVTPTATTTYTVVVTDANGTVANTGNTITLNVTNPQVTGTTPGSRCGTGTVVLGASAAAGETVTWYSAATGGTVLGTGNSFTTPSISSSTNFYAAVTGGGSQVSVGAPNTGISPTLESQTTTTAGINFDVTAPTTIASVDVYPTAAVGSGYTISIFQPSVSTTVPVTTYSFTNTVQGSVSNPLVQTVPVNFTLTPGTYRILMTVNAGVIRNDGGTAFPYTMPALTLTSSTLSGYNYYFYNFVVNNGCTGTRVPVAATVTTPPTLTITGNKTICNNTITALSVTSATTDFNTYTWSPVANLYTDAAATQAYTAGTSATTVYFKSGTSGNYTFTVLANQTGGGQCGATATAIVSVQPASGTLTTGTNPICISGTPTITLGGGTYRAPFLVWERSTDGTNYSPITPSASGTTYVEPAAITATTWYRVTVKDSLGASCFAPTPLQLVVNNPTLTLGATTVTRCGPGSVTVSATPNGSATIKWYTAATGGTAVATTNSYSPNVTANTTYYAAAVIGSCESARQAVAVTVSAPPAVTISASPLVNNNLSICAGASISLNAGSSNGSYSYAWTGNGLGATTGAAVTATPTQSGSYTVTATDNSGGAFTGCSTTATIAATVNLAGYQLTANATNTNLCNGATTNLSAAFTNNLPAATYGTPTVSNPTTDEDIANVTFSQGATTLFNNSTVRNSLSGTLGAATGTAGAYANFTAFGPYTVNAGQSYDFSVSTSDAGGGGFAHAIAVFVDFDRDGAFSVSEMVYTSSATTTGAHTETGSFTIPTTAIGLLRMRVITNEGLITSSTQTISYGEQEDYLLDVRNATPAAITSYAWSDGTSTVSTSPSFNSTPAQTTTYTLTATQTASGCALTASRTITVGSALVLAPAAAQPAICAGSSTTLSANASGGGQPYVYSWKDAANLVVSTTASFSVTPAQTTTYTLTVTDNCGTVQTAPVTVTVNPMPTVSITPSASTTQCASSLQLTSSITNGGTAVYQWLRNGSNISGANAATYLLTNDGSAIVSGAFSLRVTNSATGCVTTSAATSITLNPVPSTPVITPVSADVCAGSVQQLSAASTTLRSGTIGTGTTGSSTATPYRGNWGAQKIQYLYKASELTALGLSSGSVIQSISIPVTSLSTQPAVFANFTIAMKNTATTALTANAETGLTTVLPASTLTLSGTTPFTVSHVLSTPFTWNGTSNLVVEFCFNNNNSGTTGTQATVTTTTTTGGAAYNSADNTPGQCSVTTGFTPSSARVNMGFQATGTANMVWTVSPGVYTGLYTNAAATTAYTGTATPTVYAKPSANITYTVTASNGFTCSSASTVALTVATPSVAPSVLNASQTTACAGTNIVLTQTGGTLAAGAHWQWYRNAAFTQAEGSAVSTSNAHITVAPTATTTYYLRAEGGNAPCTASVSGVATVTVTVPPAAVGGTAGPAQSITSGQSPADLTLTGHTGSVTGWERSTDGSNWTPIAVASATLAGAQVGNLSQTTQFRALVSSGGCSSATSAAVTITVVGAPATYTFSGSGGYCDGIGRTATLSGTETGVSYQLKKNGSSQGSPVAGTGSAISFGPLTAGTYTVVASNSIGFQVTMTGSVVITDLGTFSVQLTPQQQYICGAGGSTTINVTGGPANGQVTYLTNGANPQTIQLNASGAASFATGALSANATITVSAVSNGTCATPTNTSTTIYVGQIAPATVPNRDYCAGITVPAQAFTGNFPAGTQYRWTVHNGLAIGMNAQDTTGIGTALPAFVTANNTGIQIAAQVSVTPMVTPPDGCKLGTSHYAIRVQPLPTVQVVSGGNQTVCAGSMSQPIALQGNQPTGMTFRWTSSNAAQVGTLASGAVTSSGASIPSFLAQNLTANASIATTYTITPQIGSCSGSPVTTTLTVARAVTAITYPGAPLCQSLGVVRPTVNGAVGGTFGYLNLGTNTVAGLSINTSTGAVDTRASQPGTYRVTYTVTAPAGSCGGSTSTDVTITPQVEIAGAGNRTLCSGSPLLITFSSPQSASTTITYTWSIGSLSGSNPAALGLPTSGTGATISATPVNNTGSPVKVSVTVRATPSDGSFCGSLSRTFQVTINNCGTITMTGDSGGSPAMARSITAPADAAIAENVTLGPNPTQNRVTVFLDGAKGKTYAVQLLTQQGAVISRPATFSSDRYTLDLTGLAAGVYIVQLQEAGTGRVTRKQVVKL